MQTKTFTIKNFTFSHLDHVFDDAKSPYSTGASQISFNHKNVSFETQNQFEARFKSFSQPLYDKEEQAVESLVFQWFQSKCIKLGNPEEIVEKYNHEQKKMILSKVENQTSRKVVSAKCFDGIEVSKNSLLQRRVRRNTFCQ